MSVTTYLSMYLIPCFTCRDHHYSAGQGGYNHVVQNAVVVVMEIHGTTPQLLLHLDPAVASSSCPNQTRTYHWNSSVIPVTNPLVLMVVAY